MSAQRVCFFNAERPCDITCKAAFETGDPTDDVDCYFIWLAHHCGEALFETRRVMENMGGSPPPTPPVPPTASPGSKDPKGGFPTN